MGRGCLVDIEFSDLDVVDEVGGEVVAAVVEDGEVGQQGGQTCQPQQLQSSPGQCITVQDSAIQYSAVATETVEGVGWEEVVVVVGHDTPQHFLVSTVLTAVLSTAPLRLTLVA